MILEKLIVWKPVKNYEGLYEVSNTGLVKALKKTRYNGVNKSTKRVYKEKILKPSSGGNSKYLTVKLCKNGKEKSITVHRLVITSFKENIKNKPCINHIDGDKLNNNLSNLEYCTHSENSKHALLMGRLNPFKKGKLNPSAKRVKNTITGKIFDTAKEAYNSLNPNYGYVNFLGRVKRGTVNYKFVTNG